MELVAGKASKMKTCSDCKVLCIKRLAHPSAGCFPPERAVGSSIALFFIQTFQGSLGRCRGAGPPFILEAASGLVIGRLHFPVWAAGGDVGEGLR